MNELYVYEIRTYFYCQLKKGHKGAHKNIEVQTWENKIK